MGGIRISRTTPSPDMSRLVKDCFRFPPQTNVSSRSRHTEIDRLAIAVHSESPDASVISQHAVQTPSRALDATASHLTITLGSLPMVWEDNNSKDKKGQSVFKVRHQE